MIDRYEPSNFREEPLVVDDKSGTITVKMQWSRFHVRADLSKWDIKQGIADSGSTVIICLMPKQENKMEAESKKPTEEEGKKEWVDAH